MIQLILTEEQQRLLDESSEPVQIMSRNGGVLTTVGHGLTDADLDRIAQDSRDFHPAAATLSELVDRLKSQEALLAR